MDIPLIGRWLGKDRSPSSSGRCPKCSHQLLTVDPSDARWTSRTRVIFGNRLYGVSRTHSLGTEPALLACRKCDICYVLEATGRTPVPMKLMIRDVRESQSHPEGDSPEWRNGIEYFPVRLRKDACPNCGWFSQASPARVGQEDSGSGDRWRLSPRGGSEHNCPFCAVHLVMVDNGDSYHIVSDPEALEPNAALDAKPAVRCDGCQRILPATADEWKTRVHGAAAFCAPCWEYLGVYDLVSEDGDASAGPAVTLTIDARLSSQSFRALSMHRDGRRWMRGWWHIASHDFKNCLSCYCQEIAASPGEFISIKAPAYGGAPTSLRDGQLTLPFERQTHRTEASGNIYQVSPLQNHVWVFRKRAGGLPN